MARREYKAGTPTTLTGTGLSSTGLSFTIASNTNWPVGTNKFWVTVDPGTAQEERILCTSRSGLTVTITDGDRGQDGTTASAHAVGATIWPSWSATDADEANEHVNLTTGVHGYTATAAEINILDGATLTTTELNYVDGVTSAIQTQLNAKAPLASPTFTGTVTLPDLGSGLAPVGSILMYGGTTAPTGWLLCNGQSTTGYTALAAIVGATVPDLRGRAPIGVGTGTGLTARALGDTTGAETHALTQSQMPRHNHGINPAAIVGTGTSGTGAYSPTGNDNQQSVTTFFTGGDGTDEAAENALPHNNMQPSLAVNFIIKT
jgi:microcystin-dependent protein